MSEPEMDYTEPEEPDDTRAHWREPVSPHNGYRTTVIALLVLIGIVTTLCAYQLWVANNLYREQTCATTLYWMGTPVKGMPLNEQQAVINKQFHCDME